MHHLEYRLPQCSQPYRTSPSGTYLAFNRSDGRAVVKRSSGNTDLCGADVTPIAPMVIHRQFASSAVSWKPLGPRRVYAHLKHTQGHISIFVFYAPTEVSEAESKDAFYNHLNGEQDTFPGTTLLSCLEI